MRFQDVNLTGAGGLGSSGRNERKRHGDCLVDKNQENGATRMTQKPQDKLFGKFKRSQYITMFHKK